MRRENQHSDAPQLSPKQFLKARRPERFADSVVNDEPILDRSILEYHLETLTSRSQEVLFATFARHLAEREICPNLLPQTGPTGGGDSKVDTETYPVADDLALGWYTGIGREAASERWGFAFSAKKKWRDKAISDIEKAIETGRSYSKVFFITSQFARDKARADVEDKLRKKYGLDVRILDRTWILDKIFSNGHESLAIEDLQLVVPTRRHLRKGPLDIQRELDFDDIEQRIQKAFQEECLDAQLAEDCIESADLARQLERPRQETEGLYDRAEQVTARYGTAHQRVKCAYERARTAFWWHEDYEQFSQLYGVVEERAKGSSNAYELQLLTSLWTLLHNAAVQGRLDRDTSKLSARTDNLAKELERLCQEEGRPSAVLQARALRLEQQLFLKFAKKESLDSILRDFREVVRSCEGLAGFPLEPLAEILTELGEFLGDSPAYDEMFESLVEVRRARKGEVVAARMMLERGAQQLRAGRPYAAIRILGLSLARLYKHESRDDAIRALYLCGCAYESADLLWAARGTLLSAASLATNELWTYGEVTRSQAACYRRLKWLELRLGRIPQALSWHEVDTAVRRALIAKGILKDEPSEADVAFDAALGILLLKTDQRELKLLSAIPDILDSLDLFNSSAALLYALGYEDQLRENFFKHFENEAPDMHAFFLKWRNHSASTELAPKPLFYEMQKVTLQSQLLGCDITVDCDNVSPCLELAESLLAALESLFSTGAVESMAAREPILTIDTRKSDFAQEPFECELQDDTGRPHINILCAPFEPHTMSGAAQMAYHDRLFQFLATVFARIVAANDAQQIFERLLRDELALDRSVRFTGSFVTVANVLGRNPKNRISSWQDSEVRTYPSKRLKAWDADDPPPQDQADVSTRALTPGQGESPKELLDRSEVKHSEIRTISLIREALWDKAKWIGTAYGTTADNSAPPMLILMFRDPAAAKRIIQFWHMELGNSDSGERLRIAIVRGVNKAHPHWYRVSIGSKPDLLSKPIVRYGVLVSRVNRMEPNSNANLERFLNSYAKVGSYLLTAAAVKHGTFKPEPLDCPHLLKRELHVREAWGIGRNDPDSVAIAVGDLPIIPTGQVNPPVAELLQWKRNRHRSHS